MLFVFFELPPLLNYELMVGLIKMQVCASAFLCICVLAHNSFAILDWFVIYCLEILQKKLNAYSRRTSFPLSCTVDFQLSKDLCQTKSHAQYRRAVLCCHDDLQQQKMVLTYVLNPINKLRMNGKEKLVTARTSLNNMDS